MHFDTTESTTCVRVEPVPDGDPERATGILRQAVHGGVTSPLHGFLEAGAPGRSPASRPQAAMGLFFTYSRGGWADALEWSVAQPAGQQSLLGVRDLLHAGWPRLLVTWGFVLTCRFVGGDCRHDAGSGCAGVLPLHS